MKSFIRKSPIVVTFLFSFTFLALITYGQDVKEWVVPAKYKAMANPAVDNTADLPIGKALYNKHCKSCHGKEGFGDGAKAGGLDTPCGDFSSEEFHSQTDGELFYKTTFGRDEMPAFDKIIKDPEDRWLIINYLRTFKEE